MFSNTQVDPELLGLENYERMIFKMWKSLEKKGKQLANVDRMRKLVSDGIAAHDKLAIALKSKPQIVASEPKMKYSDFEILEALYHKQPLSSVAAMVGPENTVKLHTQ